MNLVESWFSIAEQHAIHRGTYRRVTDLNAKLRAHIDGRNDHAHPFTWTKTANQIPEQGHVEDSRSPLAGKERAAVR